ncbi:hypothetical protein B0F90DRAFT_1288578 [Multifurca ochricompacta]|uniref:Uncharacterized protein n=1 Tax=Multifurca ochricompacta TaxID=376703 RepID=A0AAD4LYA4_9AGAM|nr:hypothetical protein B0F90DRAFT_1288578 [Multifurca ochricompacta]
MLFYVSIFAFVALLLLLLYRYRTYLPVSERLRAIISLHPSRNYAPLSTFADQAAAGVTSSTFDIEADNIFQGDARVGLDEQGTREVMEIMRRENVNFDQARLIRHHRHLAANGIDPSGMPLDAKAVTRL